MQSVAAIPTLTAYFKKGEKMGRRKNDIQRRDSLNLYMKNEAVNDPYQLLAAGIVIHAIDDWRSLVKKRAWDRQRVYKCSFDELRNFFNSSWCELLMQRFEITPQHILAKLEKELAAAMKEPPKPRKKRGTKNE